MSVLHYNQSGVNVSTYAGPTRVDGQPRRRWQITNELTGEYITLDAFGLKALLDFLTSPQTVKCARKTCDHE